MKICITAQGDNLDSMVDSRFGRCRYFIVVDSDTLEFEAIQNPNTETTGGAGILSAQLIAEKQVKAVLSGNIGPNAFQTLQAAGIEIIEQYKQGKLKATQDSSVKAKFGMPDQNV